MHHMPSYIGRYEIKTLIGAGGMGSLYLARDTNPNTSRLVVVKLLLANIDSDDLRERFAREARALAALNHPNIVDIYESDEFQGSPYIVMEYVRGETLAEKLKRRAELPLGQKLRLMSELCSGLAHAHEAGIIHRDIKPANLMVDLHGRLKILDFGIARVSERLTHAVQVTQLNMRIGTPGYMSPEQIEGLEIDARSDVFAVGTVCYELLTYREAFTGNSTRQIENQVLQSDPPPLRSIVPLLDPEIESIVNKALAKNPDDRYQDATALEQAFETVRWRLGPESAQPLVHKVTPLPGASNRKSRDSRADIAYDRSRQLLAEGANEAAKRFAIEALAEDPEHEEARSLAERLGARTWTPLPRSSGGVAGPGGSEPTVLRSYTDPIGTGGRTRTSARTTTGAGSDAPTVLSPHSEGTAHGEPTGWRAHSKHLQIAGLVAGVLLVVGVAVGAGIWFWPKPGLMLTVDKPEGGTIRMVGGLQCGSAGNNCTMRVKPGETINLRPTPDEGWMFVRFTENCGDGLFAVRESITCGATFSRADKPVVGPDDGPGSGAGTNAVVLTLARPTGGTVVTEGGIECGTMRDVCVAEFSKGKRLRLRAYADTDYTFRSFGGDCNQRGEVTLEGDRRCSVSFVKKSIVAPTPPVVQTGSGSGVSGDSSPNRGGRQSVPAPPTDDPLGNRTHTNPTPIPDEKPDEGPPSKSPEMIAKEGIEELLEAYRRAYEQMDLAGIQKQFPKASPAYISGLKLGFSQWKEVQYTYTTPPQYQDLDVALGTVRVKREALVDPVYRVGSGGKQKQVLVFQLKRQNDIWRIESLQITPGK